MKKNWISKIKRARGEDFDRLKFLRLDKNERVISFETEFIDHLKKKISSNIISSYPQIEKIYKKISKFYNISKESICLTAGSDLAIRSCFELFTSEQDKVITINPTFGMVDVYVKLFNLRNIRIGYDKKLNLNFNKLYKNISKKISLIIIANPNSPTGTEIDHKKMMMILKKSKNMNVPIIIDEAYYGFHKETYLHYTKKYPNLIVTRSFSKAFGLAGLRAGFVVSNKKTAQKIYNLKPMYEINSLSCEAIDFIIKRKNILNNHVKSINIGRNYLISELKKLEIEYINTKTNFFHINLKNKKKMFEKILFKNGILVRKGPGVSGYENYLRITLGSINQMKKVVKLLKKIF